MNVGGCILLRIVIGVFSDRYFTSRDLMFFIMICCTVPLFLATLVHTAADLIAVRTFIGFVGSTFVSTQTWVTLLFSSSVVGLSNATAGGWGNCGGAVAAAVIPQIVSNIYSRGYSMDTAWRLTLLVPASLVLGVAVALPLMADNTAQKKVYIKSAEDGTAAVPQQPSLSTVYREKFAKPFGMAIQVIKTLPFSVYNYRYM